MSIDLGVYFGGSSMSIAFSKDDKLSIIVNESGDRSTPSILAIEENEFSVGLPAKQNRIRNSKNTILHSKQFICKNSSQIDQSIKQKIDCETNLGVKECRAVLSIPLNFTKEQTEFLKNCAEKSGFQVLRMIRNPFAACMAYELDDDNSNDSIILVYQMGGNSIELTLISLSNGLYRLIDSVDLKSGGDQFTEIITEILIEEFKKKNKADPRGNKRSMFKLKSNAEELKHILSTMERAHCSIDALYDGIDFDYHLTRQRFESACTKVYQQILQPIDDLLKRNNLNEENIDKVVLCGAGTKMCRLQTLLKQKFGESKLLNYLSPDEVIALGNAKQCAILFNSKLKKSSENDRFFKSLSSPVYLQVGDSPDRILIAKKNTPLPLKRNLNLEFDLAAPRLVFLEADDKILATIKLDSFKSKEIGILFQIKLNETIEISVTETNSNERISLFLNSEENPE
ncbi:heat shock 70 kDa 14 [Brachionus plicatilis]|uniref:Heat shock 70 kDa 14 n=1 Tax=Brachionus plicatilis TaxID=10195 RepID=A0A3M7RKS5_BRAPC|nr:heat shock 70 kDa 14 [Brachionus plicatilis]